MFPPFKNHSESRDLATASFGQECARLGLMDSKDHVDLHQSPRCFLHFISFRVFRIMNFPKPTFFIVSQQKNVFFFFFPPVAVYCSKISNFEYTDILFRHGERFRLRGFRGGGRTDPKILFALKVKSISCTFFMLQNVTSCFPAIQHRCWLWAKFTKDSCARWSSEEDWD